MGIAVTKQGNLYNKTHVGTLVGGAAGVAAGVTIAKLKAVKIEKLCSDNTEAVRGLIADCYTEKVYKVRDKMLADLNGKPMNLNLSPIKTKIKSLNYLRKGLEFLQKNYVKCLGAAGGISGAVVIGSAINNIVNKHGANNADEQQAVKNAAMTK